MGISNRLLMCTLITSITSLTFSARLSAAETDACSIKVVSEGCVKTDDGKRCRMYTDTQRIQFGPNDKRGSAFIKSDKCTIAFEFQHGGRGFFCKNIKMRQFGDPPYAVTHWEASTGNQLGMGLSRFDSDSRQGRILPKHRALRQKWLVSGVDQDGWHQVYPRDYAYFFDFYPRKFITIAPIRTIKNNWFETNQQTLVYKTMKGDVRTAVTGQAKIDCLKIDFIAWQSASEAPQAEKVMETLLSDIRLEYAPRQ